MKATHCSVCARRLKSKTVIVNHVLSTAQVCKSPVCSMYGKPQGES